MGIKVMVKRMSCLGSCLNRPILELRWSREERVYDLDEIDPELDGQGGGYGPGRHALPQEAAWSGTAWDNARAVEQITVTPGDELRLECSTAKLINKTA